MVGEIGEDAPLRVVAVYAVLHSHAGAVVDANGGAVGIGRTQPIQHNIRRKRNEDRIPHAADWQDLSVLSEGLDRNWISVRSVQAVHRERVVGTVGYENRVARLYDREHLANLAARARLCARVAVVAAGGNVPG